MALVVGFFLVARTADRSSAGLLVLPLVLVFLAASAWVGPVPAQPTSELRGSWLVAHVVSVLAGYASLLLGSVAAAMYWLQFRALKQKEFGNVFRYFPSLESLDRMNRIGLGVGLSVLAIGLLAGWELDADVWKRAGVWGSRCGVWSSNMGSLRGSAWGPVGILAGSALALLAFR